MFGYLLTVCLAITLLSYSKGSNISDQRLCYDPLCAEPLSLAKTMIKYVKSYDGGLSFRSGVDVIIYSKSAGSNPELWGAEVGGKRGYIPKDMVREYKVFHPDNTLKYTVPTVMPVEDEKKEAGVEKQEGNTATIQEKPGVSINENPSNINSESSVKKAFDVIDGTTFYADTLGLATPTINPLDTSSIEMGAVPIESTASFTASPSDMSTESMSQSDMAPISPTTMLEKPEEYESSTEAVEKSSDAGDGMVKSVLNMMSDLVSGGDELLGKSSTQEAKEEKGEDNIVTDDSRIPTTYESSGETKMEYEEMVNDDGPVDDQESMDDEDEDDIEDEEEDEEEDEGDEDDEEDIEPVGNDENVENDSEDVIEDNSDVRGTGDNLTVSVKEAKSEMNVIEDNSDVRGTGDNLTVSVREAKSEMNTSGNESDFDTVNSTLSATVPSPEETKSVLGNNEVESSLEKVMHLDSFSGVTNEALVAPQIVSDFNETSSPPAMEFNAEASSGAGLQESSEPKIMAEDAERNVKVVPMTDDSASDISDHQADSAPVDVEITNRLINSSDSVSKNDNNDHANESVIPSVSGDDATAGGKDMKIEKVQEDPVVTAEATVKETSELLISGDQSMQLDLDAVAPEIVSENPITDVPTITPEVQRSDPIVTTEPSNIPTDENSNPGLTDGKLSEEIHIEEVDVSKLQPQETLESDQNMELDASSELKEPEDQQDDVVIESPNASDVENLQPVPEDSSSGILSILFDSLGSGYGFVSSMIFGSDGSIEVMEGQEGSSQGVSHIAAGKYSDSEHNPYQQSPSEDVQNMAAGGDSVFGTSLNSQCEESSETVCGEVASTLSSNVMSSSDNKDPNSEEGEESSSWMGLPSFTFGNQSNGMFNINVPSYGAVIYSIITGVIVLCFFLGHYFIEGNRRDVVLLAKINSLEKELTVSSKECLILKEKLKHFELKSSDFDVSAEAITSLQSELEKVQNEKSQLEKELEATTEAGLEMEHMVSQFLSSQHDSKSLMESIEQLQLQANKQQAKISSLENSLVAKTQENEKLAQELGVTESKIQELEEDLKQVSENLLQRDEEHVKQCAELKELSESQHNKYLEDVKNKTIEAEMALTRCKSLETTLTEFKEILAVKENEICVLQECLQQLKISNGDDPDKAENQLKDILNFGKLKADLTSVTKERDNLKEKLQGEEDARRLLEDHVKVIREEVEKLRKCHEAAEREKVEAQTRLEVLSSYFKEKETQLQKELGNKEALWIQKHTDASTVMQRMKSLEEEVENYKDVENNSKPNVSETVFESSKEASENTATHLLRECKEEEDISKPNVFNGTTLEKVEKETVCESSEKKGSQNETLKKEIIDQERGYKMQLATFEKKAHENWVAARQAERKLEESKQEASQLRNRLTMADKTIPTSTSQNGDDPKPNLSMIDSNGELSASPLHMGLASNSSVDMLLSDPHPHYLDPNSSPPHVGGGGRLPPPPLLPPPFPPMPLPPRSPYHHPLSPPLPFMPLPPPNANLYLSSVDGHRPPPLGRMSSPPPAPSPSQSPHLPPSDSRGGEFPSPYRDRGGGGRSSSPSQLYMPPDDRGLGEEWRMGRYCTPPPHPTHPSDFPIPPYPPRPHWEDEPPHPTSSFRPLPASSQRTDSHRELKGNRSKGSHSSESDILDKSSRHGGKL
ncbi:transport and Golgi organization protein 1-like isoform X2 [Hetaerina americana]|uniref:transport and Golgi organization protein 1-like isoform X2 n=1 Tax=Hetaerina americana TaxID=62018 RepID=UPI003A7F5DFF